jgi:tRNA methyltransferase complex GCD14 subunit
MGTLTKYLMTQTGCNVFVETGTGSGGSLAHAYASGSFDQLYSVEIHKESAEKVMAKFSRAPSVKIFNSTSESALKEIFKLLKVEDRVFFFLDAHFPGEHAADFLGYDRISTDSLTLPLENELQLIRDARPAANDVIVVDDLRIYENGPYERGNLPSDFGGLPADFRNINFVDELFGNRNVDKDFRDEGYLIISPQYAHFQLKRLTTLQRMLRNLRKRMNSEISR